MTATSTAIDFDGLTEKFLAAQLEGDRHAAMQIVLEEGIRRGATLIEVQARIIRAAQLHIGRLWQANRISVAQEHLATGISQVVLARLQEYAPPVRRNARVVSIACVEGELHDLPARLVADYLEQAGFSVRYHGANVPTDDLVAALAADRPRLIALSATMSFNVGALRTAVRRIRAELPSPPPIIIGGHAVEWNRELARALEVETAPAAPEELVATALALTEAP